MFPFIWDQKGSLFDCVCMRDRMRRRKRNTGKEKGAEKKMFPNLFLSKNMIIFWGWGLKMEELWRHWAMKFSFAPEVFFLSPGFIMQNVSCSQTKADRRVSRLRITITPTSVLACSSTNTFQTSSPDCSPHTRPVMWRTYKINECTFSNMTSFGPHSPSLSWLFLLCSHFYSAPFFTSC